MLITCCSHALWLSFYGLFVSEALGWSGYPRNMEDLVQHWLPRGFGTSVQTGLTLFQWDGVGDMEHAKQNVHAESIPQ
jgi:hypothetical protein